VAPAFQNAASSIVHEFETKIEIIFSNQGQKRISIFYLNNFVEIAEPSEAKSARRRFAPEKFIFSPTQRILTGS